MGRGWAEPRAGRRAELRAGRGLGRAGGRSPGWAAGGAAGGASGGRREGSRAGRIRGPVALPGPPRAGGGSAWAAARGAEQSRAERRGGRSAARRSAGRRGPGRAGAGAGGGARGGARPCAEHVGAAAEAGRRVPGGEHVGERRGAAPAAGGAAREAAALRGQERALQRAARQPGRRDEPLPVRPLHHARGPQVALEPLHLHPHLHRGLALHGLHVVGHRLHARRPQQGARRQLHALRGQRLQLPLRLPLLHRDRGHHRLRLPLHHGQVPRGHHPLPLPVHPGLHRGRLPHRLHVHQDVAAQEAGRDAHVQRARRHLHARRQAHAHVPRGQPAQQPHGVGADPLQAAQVPPDAGGRVPAARSARAGRGLQHRRRPALPGVPAHHLPRHRCQEPLLRLVAAQHADGAVRDRRHPRGHRGDHWDDVPSQDVLHGGRGALGPPLLPGHLLGGRLLQGGLLTVPRHLRGAHAALQCQGAGGDAAHVLAPHRPGRERQQGEEQFGGVPGRAGRRGHQAALQAAENNGAGRLPQKTLAHELDDLGEGLQHGRLAHEAPANKLCARQLRGETGVQDAQDAVGSHEPVGGRAAAQAAEALGGRPAGGPPAAQAQEDELGPLHVTAPPAPGPAPRATRPAPGPGGAPGAAARCVQQPDTHAITVCHFCI